MAFPEPYVEPVDKRFSYEFDWLECAEDVERGSAHFGDEAQEDTLVGYTPWDSRRDTLRFFKGFAWADKEAPWLLHREPPHRHPDYPWLYAFDVSFLGTVLKANPDNPNSEPYDESEFNEDRRTKFTHAITSVRYKSFKNCFFGEDEDIATSDLEWQRNVIIDPPQPMIESLTVSGGLSQLTFAEGGGTFGGITGNTPTAGTTRFTAPLAERQLKLAFRLLWMHVPWDYLCESEIFFRPTRLLAALGKVNETDCFIEATGQFDAETLYFGGLSFTTFPFWVASDDLTRPLMGVNVLFDFHHFDPTLGLDTTAYRHGWNNMPWGGNGVTNGNGAYYYATRNGNLPTHATAPGRPFIETTEFGNLFKHVKDV